MSLQTEKGVSVGINYTKRSQRNLHLAHDAVKSICQFRE